MHLYLISYDLTKPVKDYPRLLNELRRLGAAPVLKSEWVLRNQATAYDICRHLMSFIDSDDKMIVNEVTSNAAWTPNVGDVSKAA